MLPASVLPASVARDPRAGAIDSQEQTPANEHVPVLRVVT